MGTLLISKIREEYPDRIMSSFSVVPSPKVRVFDYIFELCFLLDVCSVRIAWSLLCYLRSLMLSWNHTTPPYQFINWWKIPMRPSVSTMRLCMTFASERWNLPIQHMAISTTWVIFWNFLFWFWILGGDAEQCSALCIELNGTYRFRRYVCKIGRNCK